MVPALFAVAVAMSGSVAGADEPEPPELVARLPEVVIGSRVVAFDNGLRLLIHHDPDAQSILVATRIDGGRSAEPEGQAGVGQLAVDLWHESRPNGGVDVRSAYDLLGARVTATLTADATVYTTQAAAASAAQVLELESHRTIDPLKWVAEVSLQEYEWRPSRRAYRDNWHAPYLGPLFHSLYAKGHPYHRAWDSSDVSSVGGVDAAAYVAATYRPERTTIAVWGPMEPRQVVCALGDANECVQAVLSAGGPDGADNAIDVVLSATHHTVPPAADGADPEEASPLPDPVTTEMRRVRGMLDVPVLIVGWSAPGTAAEGVYEAPLLQLTTDWMEEQLRQRFDRDRRVQRVQCRLLAGQVNSTAVCLLTLRSSDDADAVLRNAVRPVSRSGLSRRLDTWPEQERVAALHGLEDPNRAADLLEHHAATGRVTVHLDRMRAVSMASPDQARDLLRRVFDKRRAAVVLLDP